MQTAQLALVDLVTERGTASYPIYLVFDSPGGDVEAGIQFIEFAKTIENLRTVTIFAASMASGIVEALPGRRLITANGTLMFHRAAISLSGQIAEGEFESRFKYIKSMVATLEKANAKRMHLTLEDYKAKVKDEYWLRGFESLEAHSADKVVDILCSRELIDKRVSGLQCSIFGCSELEFSGCPTIRLPIINKKNLDTIGI